MLTSRLIAIIFILAIPVRAAGDPLPSLDVVRVLHPVLASVLRDGMQRSASLRALVDELERSNLLIHVIGMEAGDSRRFWGTTRFIAAAGGRRFMRVAVNPRLAADQQAATLGHELHHALEVARAAWVVDHATFEVFYQHAGEPSALVAAMPCYETAAARNTGARILREIRHARAAARFRIDSRGDDRQ